MSPNGRHKIKDAVNLPEAFKKAVELGADKPLRRVHLVDYYEE